MANRINSFLNRLGVFHAKEQILIPFLLVLAVIFIGVVYVRLINWNTGFKHVGYAWAQVLSAAATHSETSLPGIRMKIELQDGATLQTTGNSEWMSTLNGDIICIELMQHEGHGQRRARPILNQKCEQLPQWVD